MADERQQPEPEEPARDAVPTPSDREIFRTPFARERAPGDLFSLLVEYSSAPDDVNVPPFAPPTDRDAATPPSAALHPPSQAAGHPGGVGATLASALRRLSRAQKILMAGITAIAAALLYVEVIRTSPPPLAGRTGEGEKVRTGAGRSVLPSDRSAFSPSTKDAVSTAPAEARLGDSRRENPSADRVPPAAEERRTGMLDPQGEGMPQDTRTLAGPEPLSLHMADRLYLRRDFEPALALYDKLYRRLPATEENQPLRDFLLLRMALCGKNSGKATQADSLLRTISLSRLPILRALARYHQSTTLLDRKRYLEAAAKAYQTAALVAVARHDDKWVSAVQQQCGFLTAEAMTRHRLSLSDADVNLPAALWGKHPDIDPFVDMEEPQLRVFLSSGVEQLEGTVLGPQIRPVPDKTSGPRWSVICNGASIEELLARFAANAGVNVRWTGSGPAASADDNARARPVYLYLTSATTTQALAFAAGSVGLIAQNEGKGSVRLADPTSYSSLADHTSMLAEEAITLWQRFLLTATDDPRVANAHFATALLQAARGRFDEAIAEYKVVANRYAKHVLAPHALLQSGMLKVRLRDYVGAHTDLKQLVELYPETELSDRACLYLADATMKAGRYEEAAGLYRKVYNLGLSVPSQTTSALGAGRCLYETRQYEEAAKWLTRYTELSVERLRLRGSLRRTSDAGRDEPRHPFTPDEQFSAACLLLGKTCLALHKPQQAQAALNLAFKGELSHQQHVQTIAELVKTYLEQGLVLEALTTLEGTGGWQLSQQEMVELMLLRAQTLRSIGLADKAITLLQEKGQYLASPELQGRVALELAQCYGESGDLEGARKTLASVLTSVEPGPLAGQIGRALAGVCLRLGQTGQAVSICSQLLERAPASERPPTWDLLASIYRKQGRYDQAVALLLDRDAVSELTKDN